MRHVDRLHVEGIQHAANVAERLARHAAIKSGEGFIQEQQSRCAQDRPANRHPPRFTARKLPGVSIQQSLQLEHLDNLLQRRTRSMVAAIGQVLTHGQVIKEQAFLKDVSNLSLPAGDVDVFGRIEKVRVADANRTVIRVRQTGDAIQQCGLTASRRSKQTGHAGA